MSGVLASLKNPSGKHRLSPVHWLAIIGIPLAAILFQVYVPRFLTFLSYHPLGMFGIVKTLVGYFAASVSQRFNLDNAVVRLVLGFFFFFFHQFFFWVLSRALLGEALEFQP